jgi:SAM-dependent methyltransferase
MDNTRQSFTDKWKHNERLAFDETLREGSEIQQWILSRNGFRSKQELTVHLSGARRILDAGCGNGRVTALLRECTRPQSTEIVGIDAVSAEVAGRNLASYQNVHILTRPTPGTRRPRAIRLHLLPRGAAPHVRSQARVHESVPTS